MISWQILVSNNFYQFKLHIYQFYMTKLRCIFSGGTLGLFTGMSVISIFEIGFWVLRKPSKTSQGSAKKDRNASSVFKISANKTSSSDMLNVSVYPSETSLSKNQKC